MDDSIGKYIFEAIDGTISSEDFGRLQDAIEQSEEVRDAYLRAVSLCEELAEISANQPVSDVLSAGQAPVRRPAGRGFRSDL
ncbi:MAG: hypothetical protein ACF8TS_16540, partial [Maioricimonas sp. JB049]